MSTHGTRNKHSSSGKGKYSSSDGSGGRRPGRGGTQKWTSTNPAQWPVYVIGNVTFQWNHIPPSKVDEEKTLATLAAYVANPADEPGIPANFRNYQPVWGIVKRGPHVTDSSTSRHADEALHITVRFSTQADRDNSQGHTVHIYNDVNWQYDPSKYCTWDDRSADDYVDQRVYYNRRETPQTKYYALPSTQQSATSVVYTSNYTGAQSSLVYSSAPVSSTQPLQSSTLYSSAPMSSPQYSSAPMSSPQYSPAPMSSTQYSSVPVSSTQYSPAPVSYTQPSQSSSLYSSAPVSNFQGSQSSLFTPTYFKETSTGYFYCLLSNGAKIYWNDGKHWYIDSTTNDWVEYTGALNV